MNQFHADTSRIIFNWDIICCKCKIYRDTSYTEIEYRIELLFKVPSLNFLKLDKRGMLQFIQQTPMKLS